MITIRRAAATVALILPLAVQAAAIELSLEENRAERGNIGYIDMRRLFHDFPETTRAKENFEEVVRQTEDQINLRKVEVIKERNDLSQLRMERELVAKMVTPSPMNLKPPADHQAKPAQPEKAAPTVEPPKSPAPVESPRPADASSLPGFGPAAPSEPLVINIPGVSTAPIVMLPPAVSTTIAAQLPFQAEAASANPAIADLDAKIAAKSKELQEKESAFNRYQAEQERNLLDLETRKTSLLLGKIHKAVQEVARREGISVIVDKNSILYGHDAVDLTEKVLKFLRTGA